MNAGIRIIVHGEAPTLEVDGDSVAARRELGVAAWSVLEVLAPLTQRQSARLPEWTQDADEQLLGAQPARIDGPTLHSPGVA